MNLRSGQTFSLSSQPLRRAWAFGWLSLWVGICAVAWSPRVFPEGVERHVLSQALLSPSGTWSLGFDPFGRALLPLVAAAAGRSLGLALFLACFSLFLGTFLGALAAMVRSWPGRLLERLIEGLLALPPLLPALLTATILGASWASLILSILIGSLPAFARLTVTRTREILAEGFMLSAESLGGTPFWILRTHLLPPLIQLSSLKLPHLLAQAILSEATLTFLGVGAPRSAETWGSLLLQSRDYLLEAPHLAWATGVPLFLTILALLQLTSNEE